MLVEDDNNLREIYEARLLAEGYQIVSAKDGEEALALAVKEKPDLIISDVMMPKISGFDMLDILRSTPETRDTKVIMMTALSQAEDKTRADKLGADRYLVKSQVTLEDVAKVTREVLQGEKAMPPSSTTPEPSADAASTAPPADNSTSSPVVPTPVTPIPITPVVNEPTSTPVVVAPVVDPVAPTTSITPAVDAPDTSATTAAEVPVVEPVTDPAETSTEAAADNAAKIADAVSDLLDKKDEEAEVVAPAPETPAPTEAAPQGGSSITGRLTIKPPTEQEKPSDLNDLLSREKEKEEDSPVVGAPGALPVNTVIDAAGKAVTPTEAVTEGEIKKVDTPGNVIQPGSSDDPNSIAL